MAHDPFHKTEALGQYRPTVTSNRTSATVLHALMHDLFMSLSSSIHVLDRIVNSLSINVYCLLPIIVVYHYFPHAFYAISIVEATGLYLEIIKELDLVW